MKRRLAAAVLVPVVFVASIQAAMPTVVNHAPDMQGVQLLACTGYRNAARIGDNGAMATFLKLYLKITADLNTLHYASVCTIP